MEPFLDVTNIYYYLKGHDRQKKLPKETKSLATICEELLGILLSKVSIDKMSYLHFWNLIFSEQSAEHKHFEVILF